MSDPVTDILEHGSDAQWAALRSFAAAFTDAAAAAVAPAEPLPDRAGVAANHIPACPRC